MDDLDEVQRLHHTHTAQLMQSAAQVNHAAAPLVTPNQAISQHLPAVAFAGFP
jgi:hypothetical protein